jgi:hypothetical protein
VLVLLVTILAVSRLFSGAAPRAASDAACIHPYAPSSPWNTRIGPKPLYDAASSALVSSVTTPLSSDPTQYTYPVYVADPTTPTATVNVLGTFSDVVDRGRALNKRTNGATVSVPMPADARPSTGTDGQLIVVDSSTGDEWGFWRIARTDEGWSAVNGYHYNTRWSGVPPSGFGSRGAGVTYLAGLVRPCEIAQQHIDHALAFAYNWPSPAFVYPATKSDGRGRRGLDLPEGARLQLDPSLSAAQIQSWGCANACLTIAQALQSYGMYVIDNSGHSKLMAEDDHTAHWTESINSKTPAKIPLSAFRVVTDGPPIVHAFPSSGRSGRRLGLRYTVYDNGGRTRERVVVSQRRKIVAEITIPLHEAPTPGKGYAVAWKPSRGLHGGFRFCVTSTDPAGNTSSASCSTVRLLTQR